MTYEGVRFRMNFDANADVRHLISSRPELFRQGVAAAVQGVAAEHACRQAHAGLVAPVPVAEREQRIRAITADDVYSKPIQDGAWTQRGRLSRSSGGGLEHLERLRKSRVEAKAAYATTRQMWLVFGVSVAGIITQLLVAWLHQ